jgi:TPR repeat protein
VLISRNPYLPQSMQDTSATGTSRMRAEQGSAWPAPLQFNSFRDAESIRGQGSRISLAETNNSYSDWQGDDRSTIWSNNPDASWSDTADLRNGVMKALQDAALGPNAVPPVRAYPRIVHGASSTAAPHAVAGGLDPDQHSVAGEVFAGKIVHTRPAPPPPILELPEGDQEESQEVETLAPPGAKRTTSQRKKVSYKPLPPQHLADTTSSAFTPAKQTTTSTPCPEDYLQMGIDKHEQSKGDQDLSESAHYFRKAAEGGSAAGCVFYGLALRHGWGVQQDEKQAFSWLEMGCATAMQNRSTSLDQSATNNNRDSLMPLQTQTKLSVSISMWSKMERNS